MHSTQPVLQPCHSFNLQLDLPAFMPAEAHALLLHNQCAQLMMIVAQTALFAWKKHHQRSYDLVGRRLLR